MKVMDENSEKREQRNPLGMISLLFTIYYGIVVMVFEKGLPGLYGGNERLPFVFFITLFPVVVLVFFIVVVCRHHEKLYAPSDFRNEENFVRLCKKERNQESDL